MPFGSPPIVNSFLIAISRRVCDELSGFLMTNDDQDKMLRRYAAGEITWSSSRDHGFDNYLVVLAGLGKLGLRPPVAAMDGPNVAACAPRYTSGRAVS